MIHETMVTLMEGLNGLCEFWFSGTRDYEVVTADLRTCFVMCDLSVAAVRQSFVVFNI